MDKIFYLNRSDRNLFGCTKAVLESTYKVKRQKGQGKRIGVVGSEPYDFHPAAWCAPS